MIDLHQLNVKMQGPGNPVVSLQQAAFAFENKLELFIAWKLVVYYTLKNLESLKMPAQQVTLLNILTFSSSLASHLISCSHLKLTLGNFHERTRLFTFITHPHACAVDSSVSSSEVLSY